MDYYSLEQLEKALRASWTAETATRDEWSPELPETNQCTVTSLVVQDYLGGDIVRCEAYTKSGTDSHYFNVVNSSIVDLTITQYDNSVTYSKAEPRLGNFNSTREYLISNPMVSERYLKLKCSVFAKLRGETIRHFDHISEFLGYPGNGPTHLGYVGWTDDNESLAPLTQAELEYYKQQGKI